MSARDDIQQAIGYDAPGAQFWIEERLDAFRAEVLREAAAKIRRAPHDGIGDTWPWWDAADIPDLCADLINPDKEQP